MVRSFFDALEGHSDWRAKPVSLLGSFVGHSDWPVDASLSLWILPETVLDGAGKPKHIEHMRLGSMSDFGR